MVSFSLIPEQAGLSDLAVGGRPIIDAEPDFELTVTHRAGGTTIVAVAGELDLYRAPELEHALAQDVEPDAGRRVVVDLRAVTFLDSSALAPLLAAHGRQHARGGELFVLVGPHTPKAVFEVTGFDRLLTIKQVRDRRAA